MWAEVAMWAMLAKLVLLADSWVSYFSTLEGGVCGAKLVVAWFLSLNAVLATLAVSSFVLAVCV